MFTQAVIPHLRLTKVLLGLKFVNRIKVCVDTARRAVSRPNLRGNHFQPFTSSPRDEFHLAPLPVFFAASRPRLERLDLHE